MSEKLAKATKQYSETKTVEDLQLLEEAQLAFDKTPKGITALIKKGVAADTSAEAADIFRLADSYDRERKTRIATYNALNGDFIKFVKDTQDEAKVPAAYRNATFGYDADDPVGSVLNGETKLEGYTSDLTYDLNSENGTIEIRATWELTDHEAASAGANFYDVNDLDKDYRPTKEEATAIAQELRDGFNDNANYGPDYSRNDWQIEQAGYVANSLTSKYDFAFKGGEELKSQLEGKIVDSINFTHKVEPYKEFGAEYVLDTWDSLYGD